MKKVLAGTRVPVKIWTDEVEPAAEQQLRNIAELPFIHKHVAVMPDVHLGKGATVGSVIATKDAIIPAAVGVDIGCGMCAVKLPFPASKLKDSDKTLRLLRDKIEKAIPVGAMSNGKVSTTAGRLYKDLGEYRANLKKDSVSSKQIGSLGGGNHFIEVCEDTEGGCWVMLHSGSRNIGNQLARYHIEKAKGLMKQYFINLPDPDLAYFTQQTPEFDEYIHDLLWAQKYAKANRLEMMQRVLQIMVDEFDLNISPAQMMKTMIDCHHNYSEKENHYNQNVWVTRKGAVKATQGTLGIIPGSMGTKSYIVEGKGNAMSFCSCSHGAGRRFSRSEARRRYTKEDVEAQTAGVECRKDSGVIDEIPAAYKDIDEVMENQRDLVDIKYELKQMLCVKG